MDIYYLPDDILYNILLATPFDDIFNLRRTNRFDKLCGNNFWKNKSIYQFNYLMDANEHFYKQWTDLEKYRMLHYIDSNGFIAKDTKIIPLLLGSIWSPENITNLLLALKDFAGDLDLFELYNKLFIYNVKNLCQNAHDIGKHLKICNKQNKALIHYIISFANSTNKLDIDSNDLNISIFLLHGVMDGGNNELIRYIMNLVENITQ